MAVACADHVRQTSRPPRSSSWWILLRRDPRGLGPTSKKGHVPAKFHSGPVCAKYVVSPPMAAEDRLLRGERVLPLSLAIVPTGRHENREVPTFSAACETSLPKGSSRIGIWGPGTSLCYRQNLFMSSGKVQAW